MTELILRSADAEYPPALTGGARPADLAYWGDPGLLTSALVAGLSGSADTTFMRTAAFAAVRAVTKHGGTMLSAFSCCAGREAAQDAIERGAGVVMVTSSTIAQLRQGTFGQFAESLVDAGGCVVTLAVSGLAAPRYRSGEFVARNAVLPARLSAGMVLVGADEDEPVLRTVGWALALDRPVLCPRPPAHLHGSSTNALLLDRPAAALAARWNWRHAAGELPDGPAAQELIRATLDEQIGSLVYAPR